MVTDQIRSHIDNSLTVGDSFEEIEAFLKENEMLYDFDYHQKRFQSRFQESGKTSYPDNIAVYLYVDLDGRFTHAEVDEVFTFY